MSPTLITPGGGAKFTPPPAPKVKSSALSPPSTVYSPWAPGSVYLFTGQLSNYGENATHQFYVLAGPSRPNITAGWAKINVIDRAQRKGFTIPSGYDPISMDVTVQFEALTRQPSGQFAITSDVEGDIQKMEWMAGRGKLFVDVQQGRSVGTAATGNPPIVTVAAYTGGGAQSNLVPPNLQGVSWLISNIAYDDSAYSDRNGNRLRAPVTISLTEFVPTGGSIASPTVRSAARNSSTSLYITQVVGPQANTVAQITEKVTGNLTLAAKQAVLQANPQLKVRSVHQTLPTGTAVKVPLAATGALAIIQGVVKAGKAQRK